MKKLGIITASILFIALAFSLSNVWKIVNPDEAKVYFEVVGEGTKGTFSGLKAEIVFDQNDLSKASIKASVDTKSVNTENEGRDNHLRNADFFDADKFPSITFVSNEIKKTAEGFTAVGQLSMKDQTHPVEVPFTFEDNGNNGSSFKGSMTIKPYQFGVFRNKKSENQEVKITIDLPLTK